MSVVSTLSDQEALERFKESQPELRSVAQIARLSEEQFVQAYASDSFFADDIRQARRVYWTAKNVNARNALIWANIKDAAASPYFRATLFNNIPPEFIRYLENLPGYQRLFGNLDFVECDHCRSVFGPAAYFVDLMRFVQDLAANGKNEQDKAFPIDGDDPARRRRPDLFTFPLDCANTHELIPYIDLVNEVLEAVVRTPQQPDALHILDESSFPWSVPFSRPLAEIREYLGQLGVVLSAVYDAYLRRGPAGSEAEVAAQRHIDREYLRLSPREYELIAREATDPDQIENLYGGSGRYDLHALSQLPVFLEQTGLDRQQVNELIYQDLDRHELNAGLARLFFINHVDDGLGPLALMDGPGGPRGFDERLVNLSYAKLDRIHRFVRLARKLGWSFSDLDMALRSLAEPFEPAGVLNFDGISDYVTCRNVTGLDLTDFTVEAWVNPSRPGVNVVIAKGHERDWHFLFLIDPDGKLAFYDQASRQFISGVSQVPTGVFSHVAVTVSGQELRFYLDGRPDGPIDDKGNPKRLGKAVSPLGADLDIGRNLIDAYFAGQISDVRIWQGAASQEAIAGGRYRRLTGREPGLAGCWPLTENPYNQLFDLTANRNNGVMGGHEFVTQPVWVQRDLALGRRRRRRCQPRAYPLQRRRPVFGRACRPGRRSAQADAGGMGQVGAAKPGRGAGDHRPRPGKHRPGPVPAGHRRRRPGGLPQHVAAKGFPEQAATHAGPVDARRGDPARNRRWRGRRFAGWPTRRSSPTSRMASSAASSADERIASSRPSRGTWPADRSAAASLASALRSS
ncbi:MAG: LamG-like jellyroll fold domain-containing protein [Anaerolineae bacterium]